MHYDDDQRYLERWMDLFDAVDLQNKGVVTLREVLLRTCPIECMTHLLYIGYNDIIPSVFQVQACDSKMQQLLTVYPSECKLHIGLVMFTDCLRGPSFSRHSFYSVGMNLPYP